DALLLGHALKLAADSVCIAAKYDVTAKALLSVHPGGTINCFEELDQCRADFLGEDDHDRARAVLAVRATLLACVGSGDVPGSEGTRHFVADLRSGLNGVGK